MVEDHDGQAGANLLSACRSGVLEGGGLLVRIPVFFQLALTIGKRIPKGRFL